MTSMMDLIQELWFLKRDIVSDGFDQALQRLAQEVAHAHPRYPSGEPCWTWRVPEKWTCDEAYLETLDGRRLIDYADHPLHVVSYSLPFDGVVSRAVNCSSTCTSTPPARMRSPSFSSITSAIGAYAPRRTCARVSPRTPIASSSAPVLSPAP